LLYLVATPIGHLEDLSARAIETLKKSDLICCEDTRHSGGLLRHYGIEAPLTSYHKFNEKRSVELLIDKLKEGQTISLISDAGTPCLNDPGLILVKACIEENLPFTAIPGACSPIIALLLSGLDTERFQYVGFLPKESDRGLKQFLYYPGTTIALESPSRIVKTLEIIHSLDPQRKVAVARELTKIHEECLRGTAQELITSFQTKEPRGEMVLVIAGGTLPPESFSLDELIEQLQTTLGLSLKEAIPLAAKLTHTPKRDVYNHVHAGKGSFPTE